MIVPYLIQEIHNSKQDIFYRYMGSSEFEFGAIPAAIQTMRQKKLVFGTMKLSKNIVFYIVPEENKQEIIKIITDLSLNKIKLKENICFSEKMNNNVINKAGGWFDIENSFMFFTDYEIFSCFSEKLNIKIPSLLQLKKCR